MRRFLISFMILGLMAGAVATAEAKKKPKPKPHPAPIRIERTVVGNYQSPFLPYGLSNSCTQADGHGCVGISTHGDEAYITSAKITDAHGQAVWVQVTANMGGGLEDNVNFGSFCGQTTEPIRVRPGIKLHFRVGWVWPGVEKTSCPSGVTATSGTISVTLSNLPAPA